MAGKSLSLEDITKLLEGGRKATDARPIPDNFPVQVLIQSDWCQMCLRQNGPQVNSMYTVNGETLCTPHAMYVLSFICVNNGYKMDVASKIPDKPGQL